jgi:hypothetical protein
MRIKKVDGDEAGPGYVEGAAGSGKSNGIDFGGPFVYGPHGIQEFFYRLKGPPSEMAEQETRCSNPKSHEVQVGCYSVRGKRYLFVQRMIRLCDGPAFEQGLFILKKEKIFQNGSCAAQPCGAKAGVSKDAETGQEG